MVLKDTPTHFWISMKGTKAQPHTDVATTVYTTLATIKHYYIIHLGEWKTYSYLLWQESFTCSLQARKLRGGEYISDQEFVCADSWIRPQSQQLMVRMIMQVYTEPWRRRAELRAQLRMSGLAACRLSPASTGVCIVGRAREEGSQTADGHPCEIIYCRPDSAKLAREGGQRFVPSQTHTQHTHIHTNSKTHTHIYGHIDFQLSHGQNNMLHIAEKTDGRQAVSH